jgi:cytoskeletal protein CcmA (bactofilin family)
MAKRLNRKLNLYIPVFVVLILIFGLAQPAMAQGIVYGDKVPEDTIVDQNIIMTGYTVTIDGTVNGDVVAMGTRVNINGVVNGSLITVGEYININGEVTGSVYSAALLLNMGSTSVIGRDLYFLGVQLNLDQGSVINRDLYTIALLSASFAGKVNRNTFAEIGPSAVVQMIFDLAGWPLPNWLGSGSLPPSWTTQHLAQAPFSLASASQAIFRGAGLNLLPSATASSWAGADGYRYAPAAQIDPQQVADWGMGLLRNLAALLLIGLLLVWLLPGVMNHSSDKLRKKPWSSLGWGLVVYLLGWFLFSLLFVLIIALTIFLFTVTLVNLGIVVGGVSLASLSLAFVIFFVSVFYVSKLVVAFLFGRLLLSLVSKKAASGRVLPLLLGVVLFALLASVPYLGFVISTIATFFGLGALWMTLRSYKKAPGASEWVETVPPTEPLVETVPSVEAPGETDSSASTLLEEVIAASNSEAEPEKIVEIASAEEQIVESVSLDDAPGMSDANPEESVKTIPLDEPPSTASSEEARPGSRRKKNI